MSTASQSAYYNEITGRVPESRSTVNSVRTVHNHSSGIYPQSSASANHSLPSHISSVATAPVQGNVSYQELPIPQNDMTTPQSMQIPDAHSTQRQMNLPATPADELGALEHQLKVLKMREEIRNTQHRLNLPPNTNTTIIQADQSNIDMQTMISYVKKSIDVNSTPTGKPFIFTGSPLQYPTWRASFDLLVSEKDISQAQKLTVLLSHVGGEAKEWIEYYMMSGSENVFEEAMQALEDNYGDPFEVADAFRDKLESWPKIGGSDFKSLKKYAQFLKQCKIAMDSNEHLEDLNNPRQFKNFVKTLPVHLIQRWSREAGKTKGGLMRIRHLQSMLIL